MFHRYTADGQTMQKPDLTKITKKIPKDESAPTNDNDALFEMDGLDDGAPDCFDGRAPKTFAATQLGEAESEANQVVQKISAHNDFRPIDAAPANDEAKNGNGKKKKKTRKMNSKKKHQRKSSSSSVSSQSDRAGSEQRPSQPTAIPNATDIHFFSDTEVNATLR